ncbi:unnamed protein product, partial [Prorocentrum cordatum]
AERGRGARRTRAAARRAARRAARGPPPGAPAPRTAPLLASRGGTGPLARAARAPPRGGRAAALAPRLQSAQPAQAEPAAAATGAFLAPLEDGQEAQLSRRWGWRLANGGVPRSTLPPSLQQGDHCKQAGSCVGPEERRRRAKASNKIKNWLHLQWQ